MTSNSLSYIEEHDIHSPILKTISECMPLLFFRPQYVRFPVHLYVVLIQILVVNWQN